MNTEVRKPRGPVVLAKYVLEALKKKQQGDTTTYDDIMAEISCKDIMPMVLRRWLHAMKMCVSHLNKDCDSLVGLTLQVPWYQYDKETVELYIEFLTDLLSAQVYYLKSVLNFLVSCLFKPVQPSESENYYTNIHEALKSILQLIPTCPSHMLKTMELKAPFRSKGANHQEVFVRNSLYVINYCPTLRDDIISLLVHKMTIIDVLLPVPVIDDDIEEMEVLNHECEETMFSVEMDNDSSSNEQKAILCPHYSLRNKMSNGCADSLDVMMTVLLEYIEEVCFNEGVLNTDAAVNLFQCLMRAFESHILLTHALCHVQFLHFTISSYHSTFPGYFVDFLWDKFQDVNTPGAVIRQVSASYIASYIARAKFVSISYLDSIITPHIKPDFERFGPFYALSQAVFYIFVFRHRNILDLDGGHQFLRQLNFDRLINSVLNPLKICLHSIAEQFASLTSKYEIVFCYTIMEENKRVLMAAQTTSSNTSSLQCSALKLEAFFPFDPYQLKRSSKFIVNHYQDWEEIENQEVADQLSINGHTPSSIDSFGNSITSP